MKKVLLTGYSGFLGSYLLQGLLDKKYNVLCVGRKSSSESVHYFSNIDKHSNYTKALNGVDTIIHCAGRTHMMLESGEDALQKYREVNTYGTVNLANQAVEAGVKRFIFISSIKVNGESTKDGYPFTLNDARHPEDFYAKSKSEAEEQLFSLAKSSQMEVVVIRPPLVYGPGVKANFASLLNLVSKGIPLPFGCITKNKRSLVSLKNLTDLIITCIEHKSAANHIFLVSDDCDLSTAVMLRKMANALNIKSILLPIPLWCYRLAGKIFSKQQFIERLIGSLQVDITFTKSTLDWQPPQSVEDGFKEVAQSFLKNKRKKGSIVIRFFDILIAFWGLLFLCPIMLIVFILGLFDTGSPIFIQTRVGQFKRPFKLLKFRTMTLEAESVASHLVHPSSITKLGSILRKTKIDELPQLINVLKGDMSLVGPRPNLFNQEELINERDVMGVYDVLPGITGLAQIQNIDMSSPLLLAKVDKDMIEKLTVKRYFKYILLTALGSGFGDVVK